MSSAGWTATRVLLIESHIHFRQAYALCSKNTAIKTSVVAPRHYDNVTISPDGAQAAISLCSTCSALRYIMVLTARPITIAVATSNVSVTGEIEPDVEFLWSEDVGFQLIVLPKK